MGGLILHERVHRHNVVKLLAKVRTPVFEVGDLNRDSQHRVVSFSNREAAHTLTKYLLGRGYRRIAFASLPISSSERSRKRLAGYPDALREAGIKLDSRLLAEDEGSWAGGANGLGQLLDDGQAPDAFLAAGDVLALGAMLEAYERRLKIPRDIAIASFDDREACTVVAPAITCLAIHRYEIGRRCVELIASYDSPRGHVPQHYDMDFQLKFRGACTGAVRFDPCPGPRFQGYIRPSPAGGRSKLRGSPGFTWPSVRSD